MPEQLYWEDVGVDTELTPLSKIATTQMLVKWAGAAGDFNPLHYDIPLLRFPEYPGYLSMGI